MGHLSPSAVSAAINSAPAFARLGLSVRDPRLRERAVDALSLAIVDWLERPRATHDENQATLPF